MQTERLPTSITFCLKSGSYLGQTQNPVLLRKGRRQQAIQLPYAHKPHMPRPVRWSTVHLSRRVRFPLVLSKGCPNAARGWHYPSLDRLFILLWHLQGTVGMVVASLGRQINFSFPSLLILRSSLPSSLSLSLPTRLPFSTWATLLASFIVLHVQPGKE